MRNRSGCQGARIDSSPKMPSTDDHVGASRSTGRLVRPPPGGSARHDLAAIVAHQAQTGQAVSTWTDHDAAYLDVAQGLRRAIDTWRASKQ
jgi:hypothetical protein